MKRLIFGLIALTSPALTAFADDAITIKPNIPKTGQSIKVTIQEKNTTTTMFTGNANNKEEVKTKTIIYVDAILDNAANTRPATKLKRTYEKAVVSKNGNPTPLPMDGKSFLIEKKGENYVFTSDGEAVTGEAQKILNADFNNVENKNSQDFFFPKMAVKMGDSWKVDAALLIKSTENGGLILDKDKASASATLSKVYKKDQAQFGIIDFVFEAPIASLGPKTPVKITEAKMTVKTTGDGCLDGSIPSGSMTTQFKVILEGTVQGSELKIESNASEVRTVEEVK